jgi:hypothetical protein
LQLREYGARESVQYRAGKAVRLAPASFRSGTKSHDQGMLPAQLFLRRANADIMMIFEGRVAQP